MDPFTFTASIFGLIGLIDITKISGPSNLSSIDKAQKVNAFVKEDLPILSALLQETNSIFLNTEHPIPESAVTALSSCTNRMSKLQYLLQKNYVLDSSKKHPSRAVKFLLAGGQMYSACLAFKEAILTIREIATIIELVAAFHKDFRHDTAQEHGLSTAVAQYLQPTLMEEHIKIEIEEQRLQAELQNRQLDDADATLFLIKLLPVHQGIETRFSAMCKLDTGSEINIVDQGFIQECKLEDLVEEIPSELQKPYCGLGGGQFTFARKIFLPFIMKRATKIRTAEFFLYPDLDFNILIGNKFFTAVVQEDERYKNSVALIVRGKQKLDPKQEALKRDQLDRQQREDVALKKEKYERRRRTLFHRQQQQQQQLSPSSFGTSGRAYTIYDDSVPAAPQYGITSYNQQGGHGHQMSEDMGARSNPNNFFGTQIDFQDHPQGSSGSNPEANNPTMSGALKDQERLVGNSSSLDLPPSTID
ncbi:hypothetical protein LHYA1_G003539 [Lachnellula hyalina]|uniref:Uncharacterized protein n=1 Tax=Lachnellula hyalina TaxID=1316788 RepID=A0A8H8R2G1_9HELO|nr:uncharacterized protein LHYA1_G003539 [Lachnellula hyalina]TVY26451.1 hypothetical protein LHYA1_G003539 [Lachnellula hyalina]